MLRCLTNPTALDAASTMPPSTLTDLPEVFFNGEMQFHSSVLNQKFATLGCLGLSIVSAEALDGSEDVVGGLGPFEWLGIGIVMTDEVHNVGAQSLDAAVDAAPDLLVGDEGEE